MIKYHVVKVDKLDYFFQVSVWSLPGVSGVYTYLVKFNHKSVIDQMYHPPVLVIILYKTQFKQWRIYQYCINFVYKIFENRWYTVNAVHWQFSSTNTVYPDLWLMQFRNEFCDLHLLGKS